MAKKTNEELAAQGAARNLSAEFKKGYKAFKGNPEQFPRKGTVERIRSFYNHPLLSAYWQGVLWGINELKNSSKK